MRIRLLGWENSGLRCPDIKIDLGQKDDVSKVALIQMPNGTGKTTTLNLIRAALTGDADKWSAEQIAQFRRSDDDAGTGRFLLRLQVDDRPLTFELVFDFVQGTARYRTTTVAKGGVVQEWDPPSDVRRFLTSKFVNLFVFDGEFAHKMLKPNEARAEEAIDALCQLDLLDKVSGIAEDSWHRLTKDRGAKTQQGLVMYERQEQKLAANLKKWGEELKGAQAELAKVQEEIASITEKIGDRIRRDKTFQDKLKQLELKEKEQEGELAQEVIATVSMLRQPHLVHRAFGSALLKLKESLDRAKLPDATSRQFFVELADETECVCGRPIGKDEKKKILEQAGRYLGEDVSGIINALKQDIDTRVGGRQKGEASFSSALKDLAKKEQQYQTTQTLRQGIEAQAVAAGGEDVSKWRDQQEGLKQREGVLEDAIEEMTRARRAGDDENSACIAALDYLLAEIRKKIAEITNTVELRAKTDIIKALTSRAKEVARDHLKRVLVDESNARLKKILEADPVRISKIDNCIVLDGQREASVGQTLAVGYTFLTTVLHRGAHDFPLIVDSPAGPLDDKVRTEIGEMVPKLCKQFIAFTISTERENFLPALERSAKNIRYLTVFRKTPGTAHMMRGLPVGKVETKNAVVITGRDYFVAFTLV